jgi:hypothetical protein
LFVQIPDINFWFGMSFNIIPEPFWQSQKQFCETGYGFLSRFWTDGVKNTFALYLQLDYELYVGIDKTTYTSTDSTTGEATLDDNAANETADAFASAVNGVGGRLLGTHENVSDDDDGSGQSSVQDRRLNADDADSWRLLAGESEDPCILLTMTSMKIALPVIGGISLAKAVGGYCFFDPEVNGE